MCTVCSMYRIEPCCLSGTDTCSVCRETNAWAHLAWRASLQGCIALHHGTPHPPRIDYCTPLHNQEDGKHAMPASNDVYVLGELSTRSMVHGSNANQLTGGWMDQSINHPFHSRYRYSHCEVVDLSNRCGVYIHHWHVSLSWISCSLASTYSSVVLC